MTYIIRKALPEDATAIAEIDRICSVRPWNEQQFREEIEFPQAYTCVCESEDGAVTGFATMQTAAEFAHINEFAVHPDHRRRGLGRRLMEDLIRECSERGCGSVSLEVRGSNIPARTLYGQFGFRQEGIRKNFYIKPDEDALVLVADIKSEAD